MYQSDDAYDLTIRFIFVFLFDVKIFISIISIIWNPYWNFLYTYRNTFLFKQKTFNSIFNFIEIMNLLYIEIATQVGY